MILDHYYIDFANPVKLGRRTGYKSEITVETDYGLLTNIKCNSDESMKPASNLTTYLTQISINDTSLLTTFPVIFPCLRTVIREGPSGWALNTNNYGYLILNNGDIVTTVSDDTDCYYFPLYKIAT